MFPVNYKLEKNFNYPVANRLNPTLSLIKSRVCCSIVACTLLSLTALFSWIHPGCLESDWALLLNLLSTSMLIVVTVVSFCVHLYSTEYLGADSHLCRFMSHISVFTFFMVALVTVDNLSQPFFSIEHLMQNLNNECYTRYCYANGAYFVLMVYAIVTFNLYFASFYSRRILFRYSWVAIIPLIGIILRGLSLVFMKRAASGTESKVRRIFRKFISSFRDSNQNHPPDAGPAYKKNYAAIKSIEDNVANKLDERVTVLSENDQVLNAKTSVELLNVVTDDLSSSFWDKVDPSGLSGSTLLSGVMQNASGEKAVQNISPAMKDLAYLCRHLHLNTLRNSNVKVAQVSKITDVAAPINSVQDFQKLSEFTSFSKSICLLNRIRESKGEGPLTIVFPKDGAGLSKRDALVYSLEPNPFVMFFDMTTMRGIWNGKYSKMLSSDDAPSGLLLPHPLKTKVYLNSDVSPESRIEPVKDSLFNLGTRYGNFDSLLEKDLKALANSYPMDATEACSVLDQQDRIFLNMTPLDSENRRLIRRALDETVGCIGSPTRKLVYGPTECYSKQPAEKQRILAKGIQAGLRESNDNRLVYENGKFLVGKAETEVWLIDPD